MAALEFPKHASELTAEFLSRVLAERHPEVEVAHVRVAEEAHCDTGSASTAARAVLDLDFTPGRDAGLPSRVILKTILIRRGAPGSLYRNEVRFYRDIRRELDLETPQTYASVFDETSDTFGVVMEDLGGRSARFPNATESLNHAQIANALEQLAALHAHFWQSPRFERDLDWLWTPQSGGFYDFLSSAGAAFIQQLIAQSDYKQSLFDRLGRSFDGVWEHLWKAQALLASEPTTLLHGDTHLGNTYLLPNERVGLLDWQLLNRGRWSHDVTYLLVTALATEFRREHERELLAHYLDRLRAHGVEAVPEPEEAWLAYRQTAIWGFLLGWMICPTENYGEEILRANLDRLTSALEDLETFDALAS
jgi:aminoglycoside phosphotransferase (APT) family kinase protein